MLKFNAMRIFFTFIYKLLKYGLIAIFSLLFFLTLLINLDITHYAILKMVSSDWQGRASLRTLWFNPLSFNLELEDIALKDTLDQNLIFLETVNVDLNPWKMLNNEVFVDSIVIRGLEANAILDSAGNLNILKIFPEKSSLKQKVESEADTISSTLPFFNLKSVMINDISFKFLVQRKNFKAEMKNLNLALKAKADMNNLVYQGFLNLDVERLTYQLADKEAFNIIPLILKLNFCEKEVNIEELSISAEEFSLNLKALIKDYMIGNPKFDINLYSFLKAEHLKNKFDLPVKFSPLPKEKITIDLDLKDSLSNPALKFSLRLNQGKFSSIFLDSLLFKVAIKDSKINQKLIVKTPQNEISEKLDVNLATTDYKKILKTFPKINYNLLLESNLQTDELSEFLLTNKVISKSLPGVVLKNKIVSTGVLRKPELSGLSSDVRLGFSVDSLNFARLLNNDLADSLVENSFLGFDFRMEAELEKGKVYLSELSLNDKDSLLVLSTKGSLNLIDNYIDSVKTVLEIHTPEALLKKIQPSKSDFDSLKIDEISLIANITEGFNNPTIKSLLKVQNTIFKTDTVNNIQLLSHLENNVLENNLNILINKSEQISSSGFLNLKNSDLDLVLSSNSFYLNKINMIKKSIPNLKSELDFNIRITGNSKKPEVGLAFVSRNNTYQKTSLPGFSLTGDLKESVLNLEFNSHDSFKMFLNHNIKTSATSLKATFDKFLLDSIFKIAGQPQLSGFLEGSLEAESDLKLENTKSKILISDLYIEEKKFENDERTRTILHSFSTPLKINLYQGNVNGELVSRLYDTGNLNLKFNGNLLEQKYTSNLHFMLDVRNLMPFVPELISDLSGKILSNGVVKVDLEKEDYDFKVDLNLDNLSIDLPDYELALREMNSKISINQHNIALRSLNFKNKQGLFSLKGDIWTDFLSFKDFNYNFDLKTEAFPLGYAGIFNTLFSSSFKINGSNQKGEVSGNLTLKEGLLYKDFKLNYLELVRKGFSKSERKTAKVSEKKITLIDSIKLNFTINSESPFEMDNNLGKASIKPDLLISGNIAKPEITGKLLIPEGEVYYRGKTFKINTSNILFSNPYKLNPDLNISGNINIRQWLIKLMIIGNLEEFKLNLVSEPYLGEGDILSLLLTGSTVSELTGEGSSEGISSQALLYSMINSTVSEKVKSKTGLDRFSISASEEDEDNSVNLELGKKLSDRLEVVQKINYNESDTEYTTETNYRLSEKADLSVISESKGVFGLELRFKLNFR